MAFQSEFLKDLGALVTVSNDTYLIHQGKGFVHHNRHTVANNATLDHLIVTPSNKEIHMRSWSITPSAGPFTIDVYEDTVVSANGTEEPIGCLNRILNTPPSFKVYLTPTVTSVGSLILSDYAAGTNKVGEVSQGVQEWVLKKGTNYLFRVVNVAAGATTIVFDMFWYEI